MRRKTDPGLTGEDRESVNCSVPECLQIMRDYGF